MYARQQAEKLQQMMKDGDTKAAAEFIEKQGNHAKDLLSRECPRDGTCLHVAAKTGNLPFLQTILDKGVSVNIRTAEGHIVAGYTPLHVAVNSLRLDTVEFLLNHGADVNIPEHDGQTPLHMACQQNNIELIEILVENGANLNLADNSGLNPLHHSILRAPESNSIYLIEHGADVNATDKEGQSMLHYAAEWDSYDVVCSLIAHNADVTVQDNDGRTCLHVCQDGRVYDKLVECGVNERVRDKRGRAARDKTIDTSRKEYQNINKALSRHTDVASVKSAQTSRVLEERSGMRVFSPGPPIPEAELKAAKSNMLLELQKRTASDGARSPRKPPASTMDVSAQLAATKIK